MVWEEMEPFWADDDNSLQTYIAALTLSFEWVVSLAYDDANGQGWVKLLNPWKTPVEALPWLAQFVGQQLTGADPEAWRAQIASPSNWLRGTVAAMKASVAATLTGTRTVLVLERTTDEAHFTVATYIDETPVPALTALAAQYQKPGGLIMTVTQIVHNTFLSHEQAGGTFGDEEARYSTFSAAEVGLP